jgi:hypothetical protein
MLPKLQPLQHPVLIQPDLLILPESLNLCCNTLETPDTLVRVLAKHVDMDKF